MKIRLGYVSVPISLEDITYCRTITYTNYSKLSEIDARNKLNQIITHNFKQLEEVIRYNQINNIHFFRLSHTLIPLATHQGVVFAYLLPYQSLWERIGTLFHTYKMRIDTHPDQFCVLNSEKEKVVKDCEIMLEFHYQMWKIMKYEGKAILHVGGGSNDKKEAIIRFKTNFKNLPLHLQKMIILENDDKIFTAFDVLLICEELHIPMVLDYHHYRCNHEEEDIVSLLPRIIDTWKDTSLPPKMHYSTAKNKKEFRSHSEYIDSKEFIDFLSVIKKANHDIDVMLECKAKDMALFKLVREIKFYTNIKFIDETTFEL